MPKVFGATFGATFGVETSLTATVEVAFTTGAATSPAWTDVSQWVYSFQVDRGARRVDGPVIRYEAGTCTIVLDNSDRRFDPTNLSGPYTSAGATLVRPMVRVRIWTVYNAVEYHIFHGFADSWQISYSQPSYSEVILTATDGFKVLAAKQRTALGSPVGAGERISDRVTRILDSADWPATMRQISTSLIETTLQGTTLAGDPLTELHLVTDTEIGEAYITWEGNFLFRPRHNAMTIFRSVDSQATFGDGGGAELEYDDVVVEYDDATLANQVKIARTGGTQQLAEDGPSMTRYLTHTHERTDLLMETDSEALSYAQFVLYQAKDPELRFTELVLDPQGDPAFEATMYPQILGRWMGDRITVIRRPPGGGAAIQRDVFIRGIRHAVDTRAASWKTTFVLQSADKWRFLVLDDDNLGKLDSNALAY